MSSSTGIEATPPLPASLKTLNPCSLLLSMAFRSAINSTSWNSNHAHRLRSWMRSTTSNARPKPGTRSERNTASTQKKLTKISPNPSEENQSRAGLKALEEPISRKIETEPGNFAALIEASFHASLKAVRPKTGEHQPTTISRNYPWAAAGSSNPDRFTLITPITLKESKGGGSRSWLHPCILDKAAFHECKHNLGKNKSHLTDGTMNELLTCSHHRSTAPSTCSSP